MRIVGGRFRGRGIAAPDGTTTRPTSDRVRESLFNILTHGTEGPPLEGARVLDLFAGTGALGLEALSRGAAYCLFVEDEAAARGAIRENIEALGLTGASKLWRRDATKLGTAAPMQPFQLVFADPPYAKGLGELALNAALNGGWLAAGAICVLEERTDMAVALPAAFEPLDARVYGDTALHFFRKI
ncbi:16S rRNA (guanine(966)-N(2))-methyltransferase RsmD [Rhodomicrobium sp. Az07]|uniref:16S rRNA (guanine(966)-N(2))-methyltransferase RsmD n=1 Tax=Rhodomicrobium sp. Az07 TaxID=2839034 RepID=UPI001BED0106|nr:16S rRNA (guanine(966)-N(2))-methyltransferase RsmD [Rhodomicrobium sp. Az07]